MPEKQEPPAARMWIAALLVAGAGLAGGIAAYVYFFHMAK
jgi:hypothetical protein